MTDREMLELAAKAAGFSLSNCDDSVWDDTRADYVGWNPLIDEGDALRLAKVRNMTIAWEPSRGGWSVGAIMDDGFGWLAFDEDCNRAIVSAAAEAGKEMK